MLKDRKYGYLTRENSDVFIRTQPGQQISGYPVGILYIEDVNYPLIPGNVVNAYTYDFPVRLKAVPGLNSEMLYRADPEVEERIIETARHMVQYEGVRAISSACGFFGNYHKKVAQEIDVPVAMSSLVQIPWIRTVLKPDEKILILTASKESLTENLLENCMVTDTSGLIIQDLAYSKEFSVVNDMRGCFDNGIARQEVVNAAVEAVTANEDIGAVLLECSDMPPYAADIQAAVQLPVFDFITLIKWLHNAVVQRPYSGWI